MWEAFDVLLGQVSGDFSRAICGQDIDSYMRTFGVSGDDQRRLLTLGILGMQQELRDWRAENAPEAGGADA